MITRVITKEETSDKLVSEFLEKTKDNNEAHSKYKIMPGMFAFELLKPHIIGTNEKPIKRVQINFPGYTLFPSELRLELRKEEDFLEFHFKENGKTLYNGCITYKKESPITNEEKLRSIYQIGGKLQEHFRGTEFFPDGTMGLYNYQSMNFDVNENIGRLTIGNCQKLKEKQYNVPTLFKSNESIEAEGHAMLTVAQSKLIEIMAKRKIRQRERKH